MDVTSVTTSSVTVTPSDGGRTYVPASTSTPGPGLPQSPAAGSNAQPVSQEQLAQAVKRVNDAFVQMGQNLYASIEKDEATGISVVKFQDINTREVVRQYPSKEILAIAEAFDKSVEARGKLLNVRA